MASPTIYDAFLRYLPQEAVTALQQAAEDMAETAQSNVIYFGKHGNDSYTGATVNQAKLTIGAAMAASSVGDAVVSLAGGVYNEAVTIPDQRSLFAPGVCITTPGVGGDGVGCITFTGTESRAIVRDLIPGGDNSGVVKTDVAGGVNTVFANKIDTQAGAGSGILNLSTTSQGVVIVDARQVLVGANGTGVGSASLGVGHIHINLGDVYLAGSNARGILLATNSLIVGRIDHILEIGGGATGTYGIDVNNGVVNVNVYSLSADTAYDVATGAELNMFANKVTGSIGAGTGTKNVTTP